MWVLPSGQLTLITFVINQCIILKRQILLLVFSSILGYHSIDWSNHNERLFDIGMVNLVVRHVKTMFLWLTRLGPQVMRKVLSSVANVGPTVLTLFPLYATSVRLKIFYVYNSICIVLIVINCSLIVF